MLPQISVVCPTFNGSKFVIPTLESVVAQTRKPCEIIVSDDGSTDDTVSIVKDFLSSRPAINSRLIVNPHRGPGAARNAGVQAAQGEWISFIDSDDLWLPNKLQVISDAIVEHFEANFFCHSEQQIQKDGTRNLLDYGGWFDQFKPLPSQLYQRNFLSTSAVTCRRNLLWESGLFDESLPSSQDYELWLRMSPSIRPYFVREVLGFYCDRDGNITSGRIWSRWKNLMRIAVRHREKVTFLAAANRVLRLTAAFGVQSIHKRNGH